MRLCELLAHREKANKRETRLLGILSFVHTCAAAPHAELFAPFLRKYNWFAG